MGVRWEVETKLAGNWYIQKFKQNASSFPSLLRSFLLPTSAYRLREQVVRFWNQSFAAEWSEAESAVNYIYEAAAAAPSSSSSSSWLRWYEAESTPEEEVNQP